MANGGCSDRVGQVCRQFGVVEQAGSAPVPREGELDLGPRRIVLVTGPSGSGKSSMLAGLARRLGKGAIRVDRLRLRPAEPIVMQVAVRRSLAEAISILTTCGLGEPRLWLRRPGELSDGERFRARLARAVGLAQGRGYAVLLADEFCAILHRRLARALSCSLQKMTRARGLCVVAATTHEDLATDLQPDQVVHLGGDFQRKETEKAIGHEQKQRRRLNSRA